MINRTPSLRSRLLTLIFAIVCSMFALELLLELLWLRSRYEEETNNELEIASAIGLTFKGLVRDISRTEYVIGLASKYHSFTNEEIIEYFRMINELYPVVQNFVVADSGGTIIAGSSSDLIGVSVSHREYFQKLKQYNDSVVVSSFLRTMPDSMPGFVIARGYYSSAGVLEHAVIASILAEKLGEISLSLQRRQGEFITLFDNNGTLVYTDQTIDSLTDSMRFNWKVEDRLLQKALQGKPAVGFFNAPVMKDSRRVGARVPIEGLNWVSGAATIQRAFFQPLIVSFTITLAIMIVVAGLILFFAEKIIRTIAHTLRSVQEHVRMVAEGEFITMQVMSGFSEFDNLTDDTNKMAQQLKKREERLRLLAAVVENSNDFIILASPGMVPFYINVAGSRMVGIDRDSVKDTHLIDYFPPEEKELLEKVMIPLLFRDERWVGEVRIRNFQTGQLISTIWNAFAIKGENGKVNAWATISPDLTELKKATDALKRSEERFRGAIDGLLDAFIIIDPIMNEQGKSDDFIFEYVNRVALVYTEKRVEDIIEHRAKEIVPSDIMERLLIIYNAVLLNGKPALVDAFPVYEETGSKGKCRYFDIRASCFDKKIAIACRDATSRVKSEKALRESEEKFRSLSENSPEVIARFDCHLRYIYVNTHAEKIYGAKREQIIGKTNEELGIFAENVTYWNRHFKEVFDTGSIQTIEFEFDSPTFGHQFLSSLFVPEFDEKSTIVSILTITRDITKTKIIEKELRKSEQRFRDLANSMPQLVWTANSDGRIDYYNERYHDFSGIASMDNRDWNWRLALYQDEFQVTLDTWNQAIKTGSVYQIEHRIRHADGTWHWYLSRGIPVRDEQGTIIKWYGTATNIDSIKMVQIALAESENRLNVLNQDLEIIVQRRTNQVRTLSKTLILAEQRERKRFSYILHENLQQLILGAKILMSQHVSEHKVENEGEVDDVAESIQILESALQTANVLSIELNPPVLSSQGLDSALEWLVNHMRQNYGLIVDLKTSGPISEIKNETQLMLTQMVRELLNNVVLHSGVHNAKVDIVSRAKTIQIVICDKGRGFDPQEGIKKRIGGIRLGLFSIRERLKLFGGDLCVESAPGKGTCTTIFLPKEDS